MNITSIEVIRRNPGVAIGVVAGEKVELTFGDSLRVNVSFDYRGAAGTVTLYGSIGNRGFFGFDEILRNEISIDLPESLADFTPCERSINIPITSEISPGADYDLYCKIKEYPEAGYPEVDDVIDIVGVPLDYEPIQHTIYPLAYIYDGNAEVCTFEFPQGPEQLPYTQWGGLKIAEAIANQVEEQGSRVLELKVYEDTTPLAWTNYRVEITAAVTPQAQGVIGGIAVWPVLAALPWATIIKGALIILGLWLVTWIVEHLIKTIASVWYHQTPGLKDVKPTWSREALIKTINDTEDYLERPLTPTESLEEMSDGELRDYLDQLGEEVAPPAPAVSWVPIAILAGLAVLGAGGAAVAYARAKPTE